MRLLAAVALCAALTTAAVAQERAEDPEFAQAMTVANRYLQDNDWPNMYAQAQKMQEICQRKYLDERSVAASDWFLGVALSRQGAFVAAEAPLRESLKLRESVLPATHVRVQQSVYELGRALRGAGKNAEAEPLLARAVAGFDALPERTGPEECALGIALQHLGGIHLDRKAADAEELLKRAVEQFEITGLGCGSLHTAYQMLANVYWLRSDWERVDVLLTRGVKVFTPDAGEEPDEHYGVYLGGLATFLISQKRYGEAEPLVKTEIELLRKRPPKVQPGTPNPLEIAVNTYKMLLRETGRTAEADALSASVTPVRPATLPVSPTPSRSTMAAPATTNETPAPAPESLGDLARRLREQKKTQPPQ